MFKSGTTVGQYRILELIGEGGMGTVFKAEDTRLDRVVAIKVISEQLALEPEYRDRLIAEARNAARVESEHVVRIWELSEAEGRPFIALEFVDGRDLSELVSELSFSQKTDIAVQIARGIRDAHALDVVHRDIKPENIKVTDDGRVKILDFGLAKSVRADTVDAAGNIEGTLSYMSPEQIAGDPLTPATDQFSYGVLLYELFTGRRPHEGEYSASIVYSILHEDPKALSEINPDLPVWMDSVVLKLLAKRPDARFANMSDAAETLERAIETGVSTMLSDESERPRKVVTVVGLRNLSGDSELDYCCVGFTEDLIREISRRTSLIVTSQPTASVQENVADVFRLCKSDFVITGSLMKWQRDIKLGLSVYSSRQAALTFGEEYRGKSNRLLDLLSEAAKGVSMALAEATGSRVAGVSDYPVSNSLAYDCYLRGRNYYQTNKPADLVFAAQMFRKALEADPDFALAHTGLADVYAFQYMAYYDRTQERMEAAITEAEKALHMSPELPEAHRSLGRCYMLMGQFDKAEISLKEAVRINPKYAVGFRTLAWLAEGKADHETSLRWAERALELAPTDLETLLLIGLIYLDTARYTLALATFQRAIELGPDYGRAYYSVGTVYMKLGVFNLALDNLAMAIKHGGDPNSYIDAGYLCMASGDLTQAIDYFNKSIEANHLPFIALYYLGMLEKNRDNPDQAREYFSGAVISAETCEGCDSGDIHLLSFKALALAASGEVSKAEQLVEKLADDGGGEGDVLYNIARYYALVNDKERARQFIARALVAHAGPTNPEISIDPHFIGIGAAAAPDSRA